MKRAFFCGLMVLAFAGRAFGAGDGWPEKLNIGGARLPADLAPWVVESPDEYSGHYVCQSITDGTEDMRLKVAASRKGRTYPWMVEIYRRETAGGADEKNFDDPATPLSLGEHAGFQMEAKGRRMFFVTYTYPTYPGTVTRRGLVGNDGEVFAYEPNVPKMLRVAGRETLVAFSPWTTGDPSEYAGHYVSVSAEKGGAELEFSVRRLPKSRMPWRLKGMYWTTPTLEPNINTLLSNTLLWQEKWPHFDGRGTSLFVLAADPRHPGAAPRPAVVTDKGELLFKEPQSPEPAGRRVK